MKKDINIQIGGSGIGLGTLLTVAFVVLKLCKVINWSWVWVLAPLWISVGLSIIILLIILLILWIKYKD